MITCVGRPGLGSLLPGADRLLNVIFPHELAWGTMCIVGPLPVNCSVPRVLGQGDGAGVLGEHRVPYSCHHTFVLSDFLCLDGGRGSLG